MKAATSLSHLVENLVLLSFPIYWAEFLFRKADVMKLVDMLDLGSSASRRVGSSPSIRTI